MAETLTEFLMQHAIKTADEHMCVAIKKIDDRFGKGYAKAHPELLGAYMQTLAIEHLRADNPLSSDMFIRIADYLEIIAEKFREARSWRSLSP
jgi:hypothetical protein